jgi:NAD(P) transhydrogenase
MGVLGGVVTALASLNLPTPVFIQAIALLGSAGALGTTLGYRVAVTELPQTVAAFHALVGLAAVTTSLASFMIHPSGENLHRVGAFLGAGIGAMTVTGSTIAFLALSGKMKKGYDLPYKESINMPLAAVNLVSFLGMVTT